LSDSSTSPQQRQNTKDRRSQEAHSTSTPNITIQDVSQAATDDGVTIHNSKGYDTTLPPHGNLAQPTEAQSQESIGRGSGYDDGNSHYLGDSEIILGRVTPRIDSDKTTTGLDSDRFSEHTIVPRRNLTEIDVAALILNKMVILLLTQIVECLTNRVYRLALVFLPHLEPFLLIPNQSLLVLFFGLLEGYTPLFCELIFISIFSFADMSLVCLFILNLVVPCHSLAASSSMYGLSIYLRIITC
jgi:hypothetical protein